jgi:hypothetical protein
LASFSYDSAGQQGNNATSTQHNTLHHKASTSKEETGGVKTQRCPTVQQVEFYPVFANHQVIEFATEFA